MRSLLFEFPSALWEPQYIVVLLLHVLLKVLMLALRSFISRQSVQLLTVSNWLLWLPLFSEHETISELGRAEWGQAEVCTAQWSLQWFVCTSDALPFKISEIFNNSPLVRKTKEGTWTKGESGRKMRPCLTTGSVFSSVTWDSVSNTCAGSAMDGTADPRTIQEKHLNVKNYSPQCPNYAKDLPIPPIKLEEQKAT